MRGRKPTPKNLKLVKGNPGKRPINEKAPEPPKAKRMTSAPAFLDSYAKTEWRRIGKVLHSMGMLSKIDRAAFAAYCQAYGRWRRAEEELEDSGEYLIKTVSGNIIQSPLVGVANRAMDQMRKFLTEFGMTPSSRTRIEVSQDESSSNEDKYFN